MAMDIIARAMAATKSSSASQVEEYTDTIVPNHIYKFSTDTDFTLTLNEVTNANEDAGFVLYLECLADIDVTFDGEPIDENSDFNNEPLFVGDIPNTETGFHKIIGYWNDQAKRWCIGGIDYSEVS